MYFWILIILLTIENLAGESPAVDIEDGSISGTFYTLLSGRKVYAFYGIPYAAPPVCVNRFKAPQPLQPWVGTWNATVFPTPCLQIRYPRHNIDGAEDCLYLNVFTPKLYTKAEELMDVLVFTAIGAFTSGDSTSSTPDYIMQYHDLVFVSINIRHGVLGYFSTGDNVVPGNNGLKDHIAALQWVQRNIKAFGGNPNSVTLIGGSSTGSTIHYHYLSKLSRGLFHKGVSISGTVLPVWALPKNNTGRSLDVGWLLGCPTHSSADMIECLRSRTALQLINATKHFFGWFYSPFTVFGPVVEPVHADAFLSEQPINLLRNKNVTDLPWLFTLSKDEGLFPTSRFIYNETSLRELDENWFDIAPDLLMYSYTVPSEEEKAKISAAIRSFYLGDRPLSRETMKELIQMNGDRKYVNAAIKSSKLHAAAIQQNVFCLKMSYRGKYSLSNIYIREEHNLGVGHGDVINYVIKRWSKYLSIETESDRAMGKFLSSVIRTFMKTGDPRVNGIQWEPLSKNPDNPVRCLEIHSPTVQNMTEYRNEHIIKFWEDLIPSEHEMDAQHPILFGFSSLKASNFTDNMGNVLRICITPKEF